MGKIFKVDGTSEWFNEVYDEQEQLKNEISFFESHISSEYDDLRAYRNQELLASDWTQVPDGPLDSTTKSAWAEYRMKLRDLPGDAKAPMWFEESDWPLAPGQSSIPVDALRFLKSNADPMGIGTTSWVGVGTDGVYFAQTRPCAQITFDANSKVGGVSTDKAVIGTHDTINFEVNITDITATTSYNYEVESEYIFVNESGVVTIVPDDNYVGSATIPVSISGAAGTVTSNTNIRFSYIADGKSIEKTVGVTTV